MHDQADPAQPLSWRCPTTSTTAGPTKACDQIHAAFAAGAPVIIADFTITTFCNYAVLQRMLAVQSYATTCGAQFRLVVPPG